jgi:uncharacterized protein (TIGR03083 family)
MDTKDLLVGLAAEMDRIRIALDAPTLSLTTPVPACPGWTVGDLLQHVYTVHHFWGTVVAERLTALDGMERATQPHDDGVVDAVRDGMARLQTALSAADPEHAVWTWSADDHTVAFVIRRMAHETAIHRWDLQSAFGASEPIEASVASDGIDEFLTHMLDDGDGHPAHIDGSVHIHCGDVPGEWTLADGVLTRAHMKGDCALRGAASDLVLALWRRVGIDAVDVVGDRRVAERFLAAARL